MKSGVGVGKVNLLNYLFFRAVARDNLVHLFKPGEGERGRERET